MKGRSQRKISILCAAFICIISGWIQAEQMKIKVTADTAAMRTKPDIESQIVTLLEKGKTLDADEKTDEWYRVSVVLEDRGIEVKGYIHSSLVTEITDISTEPSLIEKEQTAEYKISPKTDDIDFSVSRRRWLALKLGGRASYVLAEDINAGNEGFDQIWRDEFTHAGGEIQGEMTPFHIAYEFGGDIIFYIFPNIGIGFGSGYISGTQKNEMLLSFSGNEEIWTIKPEINAIPITASLYFLIPLGRGSFIT